MGTLLLTEMMKLRDVFEVVGDVRGKGLMSGFELVKSKVQISLIDSPYAIILCFYEYDQKSY